MRLKNSIKKCEKTMVESAIQTNFTCSCGAPFIVMSLDPAPKDKITALLVCPRHRVGHHLTLDHSGIDLWIAVVAENLFRCAICGRELAPPTNVSSTDVATTFTLNCPIHGTQNNTRTVWSVIYRRLISEVQQRRTPSVIPPSKEIPAATPSPKPTGKTPTISKAIPEAGFCPECGQKIRPQDNFCYHCGASTE
jgi:hypothetical protein